MKDLIAPYGFWIAIDPSPECPQGSLLFACPHLDCLGGIQIRAEEKNCGIFRHVGQKLNTESSGGIEPHAPKLACERAVVEEGSRYIGCGKPIQICSDGRVIACDYI